MRRRAVVAGMGAAISGGCLRLTDSTGSSAAGNGTGTQSSTDTATGGGVELTRKTNIDFVDAGEVRSVGSTVFLGKHNKVARVDIGDSIKRVWETERIGSQRLAIADESLYTATSSGIDSEAKSVFGRLDAADGSAAWTYGGTYRGNDAVRPAVAEDIVILPDSEISSEDDGMIHAVSRADGAKQWSADPTGSGRDDWTIEYIDIFGDTVVTSTLKSIVFYGLATGEERRRLSKYGLGEIAVYDGTLICNDGPGVTAIDLKTDNTVWQQETDDDIDPYMGVELHDWQDRTVAIARGENGVFAIRPQDGELLWSYETFDKVRFRPLRFGGVLWLTDRSGYLYGVVPDTGEPILQRDITNLNDATPLAAVPSGLVVPEEWQTSVFTVETQG